MNREIKFRVWDAHCEMMIVDPYLNIEKGIAIPNYEDEVLLQYTGLKDKNGVEIYHKDLVSNGREVFEVEWNQNQACWWLNPAKSLCGEDWILLHANNQSLGNGYLSRKDLEVIGNIHQNPELIQHEKQ